MCFGGGLGSGLESAWGFMWAVERLTAVHGFYCCLNMPTDIHCVLVMKCPFQTAETTAVMLFNGSALALLY